MTSNALLATATMVLKYLGLSSVSDLAETFSLIFGALLTGYGISEVISYTAEVRLSHHHSLADLKEEMKARLRFTGRFLARQAKLTTKIEQIDDVIQQLSKKQTLSSSKLRQIQDFQRRYVRSIGQQVKGVNCYRALVVNTYVANYVNEGKSHPIFDDSWAKAQIIEVWAASEADAVIELRKDYPQGQGFLVDKIERA